MEDFFTNRNTMHRFFVDKVNDDGNVQMRDVSGIDAQDKPTQVIHIQPHGFSSVSPVDSHMIGMNIGNQRDLLVLLGGEHPDHRPTKLGAGNTALYNADGTIWKLIGKDITLDAQGAATITVKSWTFKCNGTTVVIDSNGVTVTGGKVTHQNHDIGATHQHTDVQPGSGLSGVPQ